MAQEKVLGVQLNLPDVAAAILGDPTAEATFDATYLRRDGTVTMDGTLTLSGSNNLVVGGTAALNGGLGADLNPNGYAIRGADGTGTGGDGVPITIQSGSGNGTNGSYSGDITIQGGASGGYNFDDGGRVLIYGGAGGAGNSSAGGNITIKTGDGGAGSNAVPGVMLLLGGSTDLASRNGGQININAGDNTVGTSGGGGPINITSGNGNTTNGTGGNVVIDAGAGNDSGNILLQTNSGTTTDGAIRIKGSTATFNPELQFMEQETNGTNYVALKVPAAITTSRSWTLPVDDPSAVSGQFLTTDASGVLSFAVPGTELLNDTSPQLGGNLDLNGFSIVTAGSPSVTITETEMSYLDGLTGPVQANLDTKLENIVEDTTPQLGADLDTNGYSIITPDRTGASFVNADSINLTAGDANNSPGAYSAGSVNITSGSSLGFGNFAGDVNITAGVGDTNDGGDININAGSTTALTGATGGQVNITSGAGHIGSPGTGTVDGGDINITAGDSHGSGLSAAINITGSYGKGASSYGGKVVIRGGEAASYTAGVVEVRGGISNNTSYSGGEVNLYGGTLAGVTNQPGQVQVTGANNSGGGLVQILGGLATGNNHGGQVIIRGGWGGTGGGATNGGDISLTPGEAAGGGNEGVLNLGPTYNNNDSVEVRFRQGASSYVALKAPDTVSTNTVWTLPDAQGAVAGSPSIAGVLGIDLGEFTVAGLPTAADYANCWAMATDASGGRTAVRSDGQVWRVIAVEGAQVTT